MFLRILHCTYFLSCIGDCNNIYTLFVPHFLKWLGRGCPWIGESLSPPNEALIRVEVEADLKVEVEYGQPHQLETKSGHRHQSPR